MAGGHQVTLRNSCTHICDLGMPLMVIQIIDQLGRVHLSRVNALREPAGKITARAINLSKVVQRGTEMTLIRGNFVARPGRQPWLESAWSCIGGYEHPSSVVARNH